MIIRQLSLIVLILMLGVYPAYSQNETPAIGIDYGSGIVQASPLQILFLSQEASTGALVPKNVRGRFELPFGQYALLRLAGGYGSTTEKYEAETSDAGFRFREEFEIKVSGFPAEGGILFQAPIGANGAVKVRGGVAVGFYSYTVTVDGFEETTFQGQTQRFPLEVPNIKISGIAQSFIVGCSIQVSSTVSGVLELSKRGFSTLKMTQDIENTDGDTIGEWKTDFNALNGLDDLGVSMGLNFHFGG